MSQDETTVSALLQKSIQELGRVSFYDFMRTALYHPAGYYQRSVRIGTKGADFFTASQTRLFGATLARYIERSWHEFGEPSVFHVVELGAGQGELAVSICQALEQRLPSVRWSYWIVDVSEKLREVQHARLRSAGCQHRVHWGVPPTPVCTVVLANEVLDALPVERLKRVGQGTWHRAVVTLNGDRFSVEWEPAASDITRLAEQWLPVNVGEIAEISPEVPAFFAKLAAFGYPMKAVLMDYGMTLQELSAGVRPEGTLRGFSDHRIVSPLERPGEVDLTADVHWDYAAHAAALAGAKSATFTTQGQFLIREGILDELETATMTASPHAYAKLAGEFKQLALPGGMGERFAVLECEW